ncbi:prepilin peptidase [Marinobacterium aestuariivivens]|uniref:Prepilin peptidase n=1 Tax=Marinobacterium aestuariivivens TaxID=1698799 RepID=A0ABW2A1G1_9GAMM
MLLLQIAVFDARYRRIPNSLLLVLLAVSLGSLLLIERSLAGVQLGWQDIGLSMLTVLAVTLPGYLKRQLGAGDLKLLLVCCLVFTPVQLITIIAFSFSALVVAGWIGKFGKNKIPYSPFLMLCSLIMLCLPPAG